MTSLQKKLLSFTCLAGVLSPLAIVPAGAQQVETIPQSSENQAAADDVVVVTGSRIRRGAAESAVPLQVFNVEDLEEIGTTDLGEALLQLPGVSESISPQSSNNLIQTSGLSTVSLRRLGDDRTLVLINGKRAVSNSGNSDRVSLSTLPAGFVERTEITTGGASAIYGSDAIAGVVNFLLEDDFEGFQVDARFSAPEASGGEEVRVNALAGASFGGDRGYALLGVSFRDEEMVRADASRPLSILAVEFDDPSTGNAFADEINSPGCDPTNEDRHCFVGSRSQSTPGGVFENGDAWFVDGQWFNDQDGPNLPSDRDPGEDFFGDFDGYNFRPGRTLLSERQVFTLGFHSTYEFSPTIKGSLTATYNDVDTRTAGGFETLNHSDEFGLLEAFEVGNIASDHPFIPDEVQATRSGSIDFDRRVVELGEQSRINDRQTIRLIADLSGEIFDDFEWEVYGTYGRFQQDQTNPNELNFLNAQFALDIEADGAGGFQCVDADARANGCVPLNIFGEGTITEAAADYIRYNGFATQTRRQYSAGGYITGPLFDLWAGPVQGVLGVEYRFEGQNTEGDPDGDLIGGVDGDPTTEDFNITSLATFPSVNSSYSVIEGYAEIDIPIIEDQLNLQGAARVGHYNTIGTIISYNAGAVWRPIEGLGFRAQYSRSQRAPNLTELFSPSRPDSDSLVDACEGLREDGTGIIELFGTGGDNADLAVVTANCLSEPGIQQFFADNPGEDFDPAGSVQGPNAGNPDVQEETADTITAGIVIQPSFMPGLTLIGDYYRIKISDAITSVSTQDTVSLCYSAADFPNNKFCDVITRSATSGDLVEVINFQENLDEELVSGVDAQIIYDDIEVEGIPGEFEIDFRYSHYFKQETTFQGIGGVLLTSSPLGEIEDGNDEFRARLRYRNGGFRTTYTVTYLDGGIDDLETHPDPDDLRFFKADGQAFHRIYAAYDFGADNQFRIYGGVNNIFNNFGPLLPTGLNNGSSSNIVSELNDALGREFYMGARVRF